MIDLGKFIEFWTSYLQHSWAFISLLAGSTGTFLTLYQIIKRLRQSYAAFLLCRVSEFYNIIQPRTLEHFGALLILAVPATILLFLTLLLYISLIYSITSPDFLFIPQVWTTVNYAVSLGLFLFYFLILSVLVSDRILQMMTGLRKSSKTKKYIYHCPRCHRYFEVNPGNAILNLTRDLVLGFICPYCRYIAKL